MQKQQLLSLAKLIPQVEPEANKYSRGSVLVVGGSARYTGAPIMSAMAAARSGAGYTTVMVPSTMEQTARAHLLSIPVIAAPSSDGTFSANAIDQIMQMRHLDCVVVGPGMGVCKATQQLLANMLQQVCVPIVLDADALGIIAASSQLLDALSARKTIDILTPHDGELARFFDNATSKTRGERGRLLASIAGSVVIAKGHVTCIASPEGDVVEMGPATQALAKAGTGDVLAGMVGALVAQGMGAFDAAKVAVMLHSMAGEVAASQFGMHSSMAEDVIDCIPDAITEALAILEN